MKNLLTLFVLLASISFAQLNSFTQTSLSTAVTASDRFINVSSATGITAGSPGVKQTYLYVLDPGSQRGELMRVTSVSGTRIGVLRNSGGTIASGHISGTSGAIVLVGTADLFESFDPAGTCTVANAKVLPWINITNGRQWLCGLAGTWVPGWQNDLQPSPTATVASAASLITPSGPLFTISGTAAITGFNRPVGFANGTICAIPSGIFTTTAANNIALASTAVVNRQLCWVYNSSTDKFIPSY